VPRTVDSPLVFHALAAPADWSLGLTLVPGYEIDVICSSRSCHCQSHDPQVAVRKHASSPPSITARTTTPCAFHTIAPDLGDSLSNGVKSSTQALRLVHLWLWLWLVLPSWLLLPICFIRILAPNSTEESTLAQLFTRGQILQVRFGVDFKDLRARRLSSASELRALRLSRLAKYASWFFLKSHKGSARRALTALSALSAARWREVASVMVLLMQ